MGKRNTKKLSLNLTVVLSLILATILPVFNQSYILAAVKGKSAQQDRTILIAFYRCLDPRNDPHIKDMDAPDSISKSAVAFSSTVTADVQHSDSMNSALPDNTFSGNAAVGYEIDSTDGNAGCDGISITRAMRAIGKNKEWFWGQIYDFKNGLDRSGTLVYPARTITLEHLLNAIKVEMSKHDLSVGEDEKQRRLATAFWICAQPAPDPPDKPTVTFGGKKYEARDGAPDKVSVGYDMESSDGKFACDTLLHWGNKSEMAQALAANPAGSTPGSPGAAGGAGGDDETQSCTGEGLSLGWILCPVVEAVSNFGNYVFSNYIQPMMENNPISLKPDDPFYKSWQGFRFLGNILLIGSLLAVVYSQTRGGS